MFTVHYSDADNTEYSVESFKDSLIEWSDENEDEVGLDVKEDDVLFLIKFVHYDFDDGDTAAVVLKKDLGDDVDAFRKVLQDF